MIYSRFADQFRNSWIAIDGSEVVINPWSRWWANDGEESNDNPEWWISYNDVKHHRLECYSKANLGNVLQSLPGLLFSFLAYIAMSLARIEKRSRAICNRLGGCIFLSKELSLDPETLYMLLVRRYVLPLAFMLTCPWTRILHEVMTSRPSSLDVITFQVHCHG